MSNEDIARRVYETRLGIDKRLRDHGLAYALAGVRFEWQDQLRRG